MIDVIYRECVKENLHVLNCLLENIGRQPTVSIDEFVVLVRNLPSLLHPVYELIRAVRDRTLGEKRWIEIAKLRMQPAANKYVFMNKMYGTNINIAKFQQLQQAKGARSVSKSSLLRPFNNSNGNGNGNGNDGSLTSRSSSAIPNPNKEDDRLNRRRNTVAVMDSSPQNSPLRTSHPVGLFDNNDSLNTSNYSENNKTPTNNGNNSDNGINDNGNINKGFNNNGYNNNNNGNGGNGTAGSSSSGSSSGNGSGSGSYNSNNPSNRPFPPSNRRSNSTIHRSPYLQPQYLMDSERDQGMPHGMTRTASLGGMRRERTLSPKNNLDAIKIANEIHLDRIKKANSQNMSALLHANSSLDAYKRNSQTHLDTGRSDNSQSSVNTRNTITPRNSNFKDGFIVGRRFSMS